MRKQDLIEKLKIWKGWEKLTPEYIQSVLDIAKHYSDEQITQAFGDLSLMNDFAPSVAEIAKALDNVAGQKEKVRAQWNAADFTGAKRALWHYAVLDWMRGAYEWPQSAGSPPGTIGCMAPDDMLKSACAHVRAAMAQETPNPINEKIREANQENLKQRVTTVELFLGI